MIQDEGGIHWVKQRAEDEVPCMDMFQIWSELHVTVLRILSLMVCYLLQTWACLDSVLPRMSSIWSSVNSATRWSSHRHSRNIYVSSAKVVKPQAFKKPLRK